MEQEKRQEIQEKIQEQTFQMMCLCHQIDSRYLRLCDIEIVKVDSVTINLSRRGKVITIKYNYGHDLYDLTLYRFNKYFEAKSKKELFGIYADQLKEIISDFFKFEYVTLKEEDI